MATPLSRIDKLFLDDRAQAPESSRLARQAHGLTLVAGADVAHSPQLQLLLLTLINLGSRTFSCQIDVVAPEIVWTSDSSVVAGGPDSISQAVTRVGGRRLDASWEDGRRHIVIGDAAERTGAIRATFDGWLVSVGPAHEVLRLRERPFCPIAPVAAAALALAEYFGDFARINVEASRRPVSMSLWRPDLRPTDPVAIGAAINELPANVGLFGLGHLGQAYLWTLAALPYADRSKVRFVLYDDDEIEGPNLETGALLQPRDVGRSKTRAIAEWLEARGFSTRLVERRITDTYRLSPGEPLLGLSGFDDNQPRQWLTNAGLTRTFDCGLGGEVRNFDTVAYHTWPNARPATDLWKVETQDELAERTRRQEQLVKSNAAYQALDADDCGRVRIAGESVAVPFVGAFASCIAVAELLKSVNAGPVFSDVTVRVISGSTPVVVAVLERAIAPAIRGVEMQSVADKGEQQ